MAYNTYDPNLFLQRNYGVLQSETPKRFSGRATGQVIADSLRGYIDSGTGLPFTGALGTTGQYVIDGKLSATPPPGTTLNTPPALQVQSTVKTPEIANPTLAAISQQAKQAQKTQDELTSFKDTASDILNRTYARTQGATDTTGTAAALNRSLDTQEAAQRGLTTEAEQRNKAYTTQTQSLLDKMDKAFSDEEAKTRAVGERAMNIGLTQGQLIPLVSGGADTVTARSGAGTSRALAAVTNALLPVEQQIAANRRYSISNFERPIQSELYRNDMALLDAKNALERETGMNRRDTDRFLYNVAWQTAGMSRENAEWLISQQLRLRGASEQFMAAHLANLVTQAALLRDSRDDVVAQPFDPSLIPGAASYPINVPGRNYQPSDPELTRGMTPAQSSARPVTSSRSYLNPSAEAYYRQTGFYPSQDSNLSEYALHNIVNTTGVPAFQGRGIYDIPNDFTWGRNAARQSAFEDVQRGYE